MKVTHWNSLYILDQSPFRLYVGFSFITLSSHVGSVIILTLFVKLWYFFLNKLTLKSLSGAYDWKPFPINWEICPWYCHPAATSLCIPNLSIRHISKALLNSSYSKKYDYLFLIHHHLSTDFAINIKGKHLIKSIIVLINLFNGDTWLCFWSASHDVRIFKEVCEMKEACEVVSSGKED